MSAPKIRKRKVLVIQLILGSIFLTDDSSTGELWSKKLFNGLSAVISSHFSSVPRRHSKADPFRLTFRSRRNRFLIAEVISTRTPSLEHFSWLTEGELFPPAHLHNNDQFQFNPKRCKKKNHSGHVKRRLALTAGNVCLPEWLMQVSDANRALNRLTNTQREREREKEGKTIQGNKNWVTICQIKFWDLWTGRRHFSWLTDEEWKDFPVARKHSCKLSSLIWENCLNQKVFQLLVCGRSF